MHIEITKCKLYNFSDFPINDKYAPICILNMALHNVMIKGKIHDVNLHFNFS